MTREERFDTALDELTAAVDDWCQLLHDPYKPPELKVGLPSRVTKAAWELGLAWQLLTEKETPA